MESLDRIKKVPNDAGGGQRGRFRDVVVNREQPVHCPIGPNNHHWPAAAAASLRMIIPYAVHLNVKCANVRA